MYATFRATAEGIRTFFCLAASFYRLTFFRTRMSKTALVIGNDTVVSNFVSFILERENIDVLRASNGHLGIKMTLAHLPDVILSGHYMPYCTGLEVLKTIRTHDRTRHIPFVSMFSRHGADLQRQHIVCGANAFLTPPFGPNNLLATVYEMFKQSAHESKLDRLRAASRRMTHRNPLAHHTANA